jgi:hypothetical protein
MKKIFLSMLLVFAGLIFYLTSPLSVGAASVDLSTWGAESYSAVSGFPPGSWVVSGGGSYVDQINNGQPTIFYSNFSALGTDVSGKVQVRTTGDDDFMGFVLGFNPGDTTNSLADFILIDWKQITQDYNFTGNTATNATPGTTANAGLAVSRITGTPSADEIWGHTNFTTENPGGGVSELTRALTLGSTGWIDEPESLRRQHPTGRPLRQFP